MRTVYHFQLCPFSRKVRVALAEKGLDFNVQLEPFWERRVGFAHLNPAMQVPVLVEPDNKVIPDSYAICEYLEVKYPNATKLLGQSPEESAGIRRLVSWFDNKFYLEVTRYLLNEKVVRYMKKAGGEPHSEALRVANANVIGHMDYLAFLLGETRWLMGEAVTLADIAAASHLSVVDYLSGVPWERYRRVKEWYVLLKSRPSFRPLLNDRVPGFAPPVCYSNLDF